MTTQVDDDLLDLADEAAMNVADMDVPLRAYLRAALAAVIPLVQAAEREACAEVVEKFDDTNKRSWEIYTHKHYFIVAAAAAIRARNPA